MIFRPFYATTLTLLSFLVDGVLPHDKRKTTKGSSTYRAQDTLTFDQEGYFHRDRKAQSGYEGSNDEFRTHNVFNLHPVLRSESDFVVYCEDWFLSSQNDLSNAFITQGDLIDFLVETCYAFDQDDLPQFDCPAPSFMTIALDVQLVFVKHLCNVKVGEEMVECLKSIVEAGRVFGHNVDLTKSPFAEELCCGLLPFVELVGLEKNADCPHIPNTRPTSQNIPTPSPDLASSISSSPIESPNPNPSFAPSSALIGSDDSSAAPSSFLPIESTNVPTFMSGLPPPSPATQPAALTLPPTPSPISMPSMTSSSQPVTISLPTEASEPTDVGAPTEAGSPVASNEGVVNENTDPDDTISVATITGIALGLGAVLIMGIVSSRRRARKREEAELTDSTPDESSSSY